MKASHLVTSHTFSITDCGLITSSEWVYFRQSRLRHSLICFHQSDNAGALIFDGASAASNCTSNSCNTSLTLPTMGIYTLTRLEIEDGSISIWMILRGCVAKCFGLPITRSSKRAPMAISTSECCIAMLASYVPCMPGITTNLSLEEW